MKRQIRKYFSFSRSDQNVLLLLCIILTAMVAAYWLIPRFVSPHSQGPDAAFDQAVQNYQEGLVARQEQGRDEKERKRKQNRYSSFAENGYTDPEFLPKYNREQLPTTNNTTHTPQQPIQLAPFDPNALDQPTAIALGLSPKVAKTIEKYLQKGGRFRKKEDLQKIYGITEADYQRLEPYITLPQNTAANSYSYNNNNNQRATAPNATSNTDANNNSNSENEQRLKPDLFSTDNAAADGQWRPGTTGQLPPNANDARYASFKSKTADLANLKIDINTADTTTWKKLPGIGSGRAKTIVKFRNNLGGFASVEQVKETFGIPPEVYAQIAPYLENKHPEMLQKINVNTATYDQLNAHPYIDPQTAKVIIKYRQQHGNYAQISDLKKTDLVTDALLSKIEPYLSLQ